MSSRRLGSVWLFALTSAGCVIGPKPEDPATSDETADATADGSFSVDTGTPGPAPEVGGVDAAKVDDTATDAATADATDATEAGDADATEGGDACGGLVVLSPSKCTPTCAADEYCTSHGCRKTCAAGSGACPSGFTCPAYGAPPGCVGHPSCIGTDGGCDAPTLCFSVCLAPCDL
ncbi:MAG: hypothetical protein IPJ34_14490 [Myxococcales bacterium]|nr:hypothetical protein [Myxococcales bacterium]